VPRPMRPTGQPTIFRYAVVLSAYKGHAIIRQAYATANLASGTAVRTSVLLRVVARPDYSPTAALVT